VSASKGGVNLIRSAGGPEVPQVIADRDDELEAEGPLPPFSRTRCWPTTSSTD
jgi:hypothetical protein